MKQPTYRGQWLVVVLIVAAAAGWVARGQSWYRRNVIHPAPIADADRAEDRFLALLFPRITPGARKYAMSRSELSDLLGALKRKGYVSIGLEDAREFYAKRRLLPRKAVLLAFTADDPHGLMLADRALKKLRMRGNAFLVPEEGGAGPDKRRHLTSHAIAQMLEGGAWEFGRAGRTLEAPGDFTLRFSTASELGLNGPGDDPKALHIMNVRAERLRELNERIIDNSWPRGTELADDFSTREFDPDWIPGWGVISKGEGRLALLPLPRQTGAGVFLRGTEQWRDVSLEFDLNRHQKEFWAYARYRGEAGYVRAGVRGDSWYVEQKLGPKNLPTMLARAPVVDDGRPAHVRFVLKGDRAILHVNGRMLFGRSLHVHPNVASGRVLFGVYDARSRSALAVLSRLRAAPVKEEWIAFKDGVEESRLEALRDDAVFAGAITPRWLAVAGDGSVLVNPGQEALIRSLAGFYGCRLIPMAELSGTHIALLTEPAAAARLLGGLEAAARELDSPGVNLRMAGSDLERPETFRFLARLRARFHASGRKVWVTADAGAAPSADGLLRPSAKARGNWELLDAVPAGPVNAAPKEFASIP